MHPILVPPGAAAVPVRFVAPATWADIRGGLDAPSRAFADAAGFEPGAGRHLLLPGPDGGLAGVLFGLDAEDHPARDPFLAGRLPRLLPAGAHRVVEQRGGGGRAGR